jgi:hypothetical protein
MEQVKLLPCLDEFNRSYIVILIVRRWSETKKSTMPV